MPVNKNALIRYKTMCQLPFEKKEKQAILFIGIQASGKTTFYNQMLSDGTYAHISLDVLHTRNKENRQLDLCLESGKSFVIDNTNPETADRARYIGKAKEYGFQVIGLFFQSKLRDCLGRNEERGGKVPPIGIAGTYNKLQMPSRAEGFDELYFVSIDNNGYNITTWRE